MAWFAGFDMEVDEVDEDFYNEKINSNLETEINIKLTDTVSDSYLLDVLEEEKDIISNEAQARIVDISEMVVPKTNPKKVYAHYMPWFQSKDYDGYWGHHWTMNNQNPDIIDENGKRQIASFFYPEIGPYSSTDPDLQEYHFLMMKLAGIDGVIFDWYGSRDYYDYGVMKEATETFMWRLEDLGLDFSIMYEDRTAVQAVDLGYASDKISAAKEDFNYVKDTYLSSPKYMKWNDKPLMFVFGPHHIQNTSEWDEIFTVFTEDQKPHYVTLWGATNSFVGESATGEFAWIDQTHLEAHGHYYWHMNQIINEDKLRVGSVYPSFMNFSELGGWGLQHLWQITPDDGNIFTETLNYTHHQTADFIQLVTWNDFGEGTVIEPTEEFGFMYLQLIQEYTGVEYTPEDLQMAQDLYLLRKSTSNIATDGRTTKDETEARNTSTIAKVFLDRAYKLIKKGKTTRAKLIIEAVKRFYNN